MAVPVFESVTHTLVDGLDVDFSMPATRPNGDFYVLHAGSDSNNTFGAPAGWTELVNTLDINENTGRYLVAWRFGLSEPASYNLTGQPEAGVATVIRVSGIHATTPVNQFAFDRNDTADAVAPTVTPDVAETLILRFFSSDGQAFTAVPATERYNETGSGDYRNAGSSENGPAADSPTGTATATMLADEWFAATLAIAPVAGASAVTVTASPALVATTAQVSSPQQAALAVQVTPSGLVSSAQAVNPVVGAAFDPANLQASVLGSDVTLTWDPSF